MFKEIVREAIYVLALAGLIALVLASPSQGAIVYIDIDSGDDTTGTGTYSNPWQTIDKCTTGLTGGDECRIAKTPITTLSGTLTFTNGSTTVNTSTDLTSEVAVGDIVGKNVGYEAWWEVTARDASTLTLKYQYWGVGTSGAAVTGYVITPDTNLVEFDIEGNGTSTSSRIKISGGWDLSTQTQDGITAWGNASYTGLDIDAKDYIELSNFIIFDAGTWGLVQTYGSESYGIYIHDVWVSGSTGQLLYLNLSPDAIVEDVVLSGGEGDGVDNDENGQTFTNIYMFSVGNGSSDTSIAASGAHVRWENIYAYNSYGHCFSLVGADIHYFENANCETTQYSTASCVYMGGNGVSNVYFEDLTCSNIADGDDVDIPNAVGLQNVVFNNTTWDSGSINDDGGAIRFAENPEITITADATDSIAHYYQFTVEHDSSAECRSGSCLKIRRTYAISYRSWVKIGTYKVTSAAKDLYVRAWMKLSGSYNGETTLFANAHTKYAAKEDITLTTSWAQYAVVIDSADLVVGDYVELWLQFSGTNASAYIYVDDFNVAQ